jgi:hypothetical protein
MDEICSGRIYRKNCHDCGQGIQFSGQVSGSRPQFSVPVRGKPVVRRDLAVFENSPMSSPFVEATATQAAQAGIPISKEIQVFKYPGCAIHFLYCARVVQVLLEQMRDGHSP